MHAARGILAAAVILLAAGPTSAAAAPLDRADSRISGASPFPACSAKVPDAQRGAETEPHLAVTPAGTLLAAWHQDRKRGGGAVALGVGRSTDGGRTWRRVTVPGVTTCPVAGGQATSDPWLAVGGDGTVYLASLPGAIEGGELRANVAVSRSTDDGATWSAPVTVAGDRAGNDKETMTAHPRRPGVAYVVWTKDFTGALLSQTTDGGVTWSAPRTIWSPRLAVPFDLRLTVLPDDSLALTAMAVRSAGTLVSLRSTDDGLTWSAPSTVATLDRRDPADADRRAGQVRTGLLHSPALAPDGRLHVVWPVAVGTRAGLWHASSTDGGARWTAPRRIVRGPAVLPALAAHPTGALGLTWYGLRRNRRGARGIPAHLTSATSADAGRTWRSRERYALDFERAPLAGRMRFLGDYTGLVPRGPGFVAAVSLPSPLATRGRSDIVAMPFRP